MLVTNEKGPNLIRNLNRNMHLGLHALLVLDESILPTLISARNVTAFIRIQINVLQSVKRSVILNSTTYHATPGVDSSVRKIDMLLKMNIQQQPRHQTLHQPQTLFSRYQDTLKHMDMDQARLPLTKLTWV